MVQPQLDPGDPRTHETFGDKLTAGVAGGAAFGAVTGLIVPGIGSVVGSVVGGLVGAAAAGLSQRFDA